MGHGVTVDLDDCPENKTHRNFTHRFKLVSLVCVLALLNSREEQIALLRGLSDNDCLFACAFFFGGVVEQFFDKTRTPPSNDHSPLLPEDQEDRASRPDRGHPA